MITEQAYKDSADMIGTIYTLEHPVTGDIRYVGQTKMPLLRRLSSHIDNRKKSYSNSWVKSLKKLGLKPIIKEVETAEKSQLDNLEIFYISLFKSWGFRLTNLESGGNGNKTIADSSREKMRVAKLGIKLSEQHKINIQKSLIEARKNPDYGRKLSRSLIGNTRSLGNKASRETKRMQAINAPRRKSVFCGALNIEFISISDCAKELNVSYQYVAGMLNGNKNNKYLISRR